MLSPAAYAERPAGGGGAGGAGGPGGEQMREAFQAMRVVDSYWTGVAFELKVDDAKLAELRPKFQAAWDARKAAFEKARANQDRAGAMETLKKVNADLEDAIKGVLGEDQFAKLKAAATQGGMGMMMGGGRGGRGGGGGGGGQQ
jgi:hypothetical protein